MFPRLFHVGSFSLPTYGLLVSIGVLLGLWISVRNSAKQGINPDDAWNLGILVVLCGIVGAKILYIVVDWGYYMSHPSEIFSLGTLQAGGVFSGGLIDRLRRCRLVHPQTPHARPCYLRCFLLPDSPSDTLSVVSDVLPPGAVLASPRIPGGA